MPGGPTLPELIRAGNMSTIEVLQETIEIRGFINPSNEPAAIKFGTRYGRGHGFAHIWLDNFPGFVTYLQSFEEYGWNEDSATQREETEVTRTTKTGETNIFWVEKALGADEVRLYVCWRTGKNPGKGVKPVRFALSDIPEMVMTLEKVMEHLIQMM